MSKHFFCLFSLTIIFVSTNLLSMHNNRLSKNYVYSKKDKDSNQKPKFSLPSPLSPTPHIQQHSIALQANNTNQYSLIFNHNQHSRITNYLIDGKSVAKLMQIGDEINFESDNSKKCNFSVQIPYLAALAINTHGEFRFEKKIDAINAYLKSKAIDFSDNFLTSSSLIVEADDCINRAQITCSDFLFQGENLEFKDKSSLSPHQSLTIIAQAFLSRGVIDTKKDSLIKSSRFYNSGNFTSGDMSFEGDAIVNEKDMTIEGSFHCASKTFEQNGTLDVLHDLIMKKGNIFSSSDASALNIQGDWKALFNYFYLQGSLSVKDLFLEGKYLTTESPMHCIAENASLKFEEDVVNAGTIKILEKLNIDSQNIGLKSTSSITTQDADLKVKETLHNEGTVSVKNHLSAHARRVLNKGKIETNSSDIKAERYYYNGILSLLSAKNNLTINTPLSLNLFGITHAQKLMVNSGLGINALGIYMAKTMDINALIALNGGFLLPKINRFGEIFTRQNLCGLAESLFIKHIPRCGAIYGAGKNLPEIYQKGKTFLGEAFSFYKEKDRRATDIIIFMCAIKNMFCSAKQTFSLGKQNYNTLSDTYHAHKTTINNMSFQSIGTKAKEIAYSAASTIASCHSIDDIGAKAKEITQSALSTIAPDQNIGTKAKEIAHSAVSTIISSHCPRVDTTSMIDLNCGAAIGINNQSSTIYNRNSSASLYAYNNIDTRYGNNTGYMGAGNLNIKATSSYNANNHIGMVSGNIEAYELDINAPVSAITNVKLQGTRSAKINGDVTAQHITLKSDRSLDVRSNLNATTTHMHAKEIEQSGTINAQQTRMIGDRITNDGTIKSPTIIVERADLPKTHWLDFRDKSYFHNKGKLLASDKLFVESGEVHLYQESEISTPNANFKTKGEWLNEGKFDTQTLAADTTGNFQNQGDMKVSEQFYVDAHDINLGDKTQITAPNIHLKSCFGFQNSGDINTQTMALDARYAMINKGSLKSQKLIVGHSRPENNGRYRKNNTFCNEGKMEVSEQLVMDIQSFESTKDSSINAQNTYIKSEGSVKNNGQLKSEQCIIDAGGYVTNNGEIDIEQSFHIKGKSIAFNKQSTVKAKDAYYKSEQDVWINGVMDIEKGTVDAQGRVTAIGKLGASESLNIKARDISIEKTGHVSAPTTYLKADRTIDNEGKISASNLLAHTQYMLNAGKITADNNAHIKADRFFWNLGSINVENNLQIDSLVSLNSFGYIGANSILTHAIVDFNVAGIYQGCNVCQHSIFGWNAGLVVPKFKSSNLQELMNRDNLKKLCFHVGLSLARQYAPMLATAYSVGTSLVLCHELSKNIRSLYDKEDLCVTDVVPILCEAKTALSSVVQVGENIYQNAEDYSKTFRDCWNTIGDCSKTLKETTKDLNLEKTMLLASKGKELVSQGIKICLDNQSEFITSLAETQVSTASSLVLPQISRNSIIDINNGLIIGFNGNSQSVYNENNGAYLFANNYSMNTVSGYNSGLIVGTNTSINAHQSYSSDGDLVAGNLSMVANDLAVTGTTCARNNMSLKAHRNATIDEEVKAHQVAIQGKNVHLGKNADISANAGSITAQSLHGEEGNSLQSTDGIQIQTNQIDNHGTISGPVTLDFKGNANDLNRIGSVDQITYIGTLDNNLPDTLAHGHNELLNVKQGGSVTICAHEQDVHFNQEHNLSHTLQAQTDGNIKSDKNLSSENSIMLIAKGDIDHACVKSKGLTALKGKNIRSEGHAIRQTSGENYKDTCQESSVSGGQVFIETEENLYYKGTRVHSGRDGTQAKIGGKLHADGLELEEHSKTENVVNGKWPFSKATTTTIEDHKTTIAPCTFSSDGATYITAQNGAELNGTIFASKDGTFITGPITQIFSENTHKHTEEIKHGDKIVEHSTTISSEQNTIKFYDETPPILVSDQELDLHLECTSGSITIHAPAVSLRASEKETKITSQKHKTHLGVWDRGTKEETCNTQYKASFTGILNTTAQHIRIEDVKNSIPATINAAHSNATIARLLKEDIHTNTKNVLYSHPNKVGMFIAATAISLAVQTLAPVLGAGFAKLALESAALQALATQTSLAALNTLCQQAAAAFLQCDGDFKKATQQLASKETVRNIALAIISSMANAGFNKALDKVLPPATTFKNRCLNAPPRELINGGIRCVGDIAHGKDPKQALKDNSKRAGANILGIIGSGKIGELYKDEKIGALTHKALHTALGAAEGAIINGKEGAIAGAVGACIAETIADIASPNPPSLDAIYKIEAKLGRPLTEDEFAFAWNKQIARYLNQAHHIGDASKIIASTVALLADQDLSIASDAARNAIDNNCIPYFIGLAVTATSTAYMAYSIHKTYETEGTEAALKQLGIEIALNAACVGIFKYGGMIYPSAKAAFKAALNNYPGLKLTLGNATESLIFSSKELVKKMEQQALRTSKFINPSLTEDLVEHIIPNSVINKTEKCLAEKATQKAVEQLKLPAPEKLLALPRPGKIKSIVPFETVEKHIFSVEHAKNGILNWGETKEIINDKIVEIIKKADAKNLLQEGPNNIVTHINGQEITIRAFLKGDHLWSYDAFPGLSNRKVKNIVYI